MSNLCIDERIFYIVHFSYKKDGSSMKIYKTYNQDYIQMKNEKQLKRLQIKLSRQVKDCYNYLKTKIKISIVYTKIRNYRKHNLNDIANEIENEHDII